MENILEAIDTVKVICGPLCSYKHELDIRESTENKKGNEVEIIVTANKDDVSKLIGRQGIVANAVRQVMSIKARGNNTRIKVTFQAHEE